MNISPQLVLLPGLGADRRLFRGQEDAFPDLVVPPWISPQAQESLAGYAQRFAETLAPARPFILGGVSFGGMVAYEMARHLRPEAVLLIGSCRSPKAVGHLFRVFRPILPILPVWFFDLVRACAPWGLRMARGLSPAQWELCVAISRDADPRLIKWGCRAILGWKPGPLPGVRIFQIHGQRDLLISAKRAGADELVPDGGHLICLTHTELVNEFLMRSTKDLTTPVRSQ